MKLKSLILTTGLCASAGLVVLVGCSDDSCREGRCYDSRGTYENCKGSTRADRARAERIHDDLVADGTLSRDAQNVEIRVYGESVTLRGPVETRAEAVKVASIARRYTNHVHNKLWVESRASQ